MSDLPVPEQRGSEGLPERRLSSTEMEAVIRRAVELQASAAPAGEGVSEEELVRIGGELGLPAAYIQQAMAEVRSRGAPESGVMASAFGPARVSAGRLVALDAEHAQRDLERYFRECEHMTVQRRRPGWTVYERASGIAAAIGRATQRTPLVKSATVEVSVQPADEARSYVSLAVSLSSVRGGVATGTVFAGGGGGAAVATALGIAVAPPAALLGVPVLFATWWGMRQAYETVAARTRLRLESVIDRLESGELLPPASSWRDAAKILKF